MIETPQSWMLLGERLAYKVIKPVPGDGLDSDAPETQRRRCEDEVRLNRRLAGVGRQEVLAIHGPAEVPGLAGRGQVLGYAVAMDRVAASSLGSLRLARGTLEPGHVVRLAESVDRLHRAARSAWPGMAAVRADTPLADMRSALVRLGAAAPSEAYVLLDHWLRLQASMLPARLGSRLAGGHVREGHGDLRLEHVAVQDDETRVFTGVEHDPTRRWIDVLSDVAGMMVDLMLHGRRDLAFIFLNRYLELSGDYAGLDVLRFHLVLRAVQRAADLSPGMPGPPQGGVGGVAEHLSLALRIAQGADPRLLITHGLPGAGKSFATELLLKRAGAIRICSAVEQRRLSGEQPWPPGDDRASAWPARASAEPPPRHGPTTQLLTFDRLRMAAARSLGAGFPTIVDAACLLRWQRDGLHAVAGSMGVPFTILDCQWAEHGDRGQDLDALRAAGGEPLGELEQHCTVALRHGEPLSPATLAALWLRAPASLAVPRPGTA